MMDENKLEIDLVNIYCAAWNEKDKIKRRNMLNSIWSEKGKYIDPRSNLQGVNELVDHIEKIQATRPGTKILRTSVLDIHHGIGRFNWQLFKEDESILLKGIDIVYFKGGKIEKIIGFFGDLK